MTRRRVIFYGWIMVFLIALMSFGSVGARFSFSAFFKPMTEEFGWDRTALAAAASLNLILAGVLRPFGGYLVDRFGPKTIAIWGLVVGSIVMFSFSFVTQLWQAYVLFALLSIGYVAGPVATVKIVGSWFVRRRALAFSVASTGIALGELIVVPIAMWMLIVSNWQTAYLMLAGLLIVILLPVVLFLKDRPELKGLLPDGDEAPSAASGMATATLSGRSATLGEALRSGTFWKLGVGFFVCGLTMSFANTHFIAFATDMGFEPMVAATAIGMVGGFSILGSLSLGYLSDRIGRKNVLAAVYFLRGASFLLMLSADNPVTLYLASFVLGVSWTATTPLTSAMAADLWGMASIGVIFGSLFTVMPIGSGIGATLDAWIFDTTTNYRLALWINVFAGLIAGLSVLSIKEKRAPKAEAPTPVGAAASKG